MKEMRGSGAITGSADWTFWPRTSCFSIGMTNVLFLVTIWLQIAHLFVADSLSILPVLASAELVLEPTHFSPACARVIVAKKGPTR
jgi:cytochrome c biogenesis protein CcdA